MSSSAHTSSPSTQECFFLDNLPAELRNVIYELVFVPITITRKKAKKNTSTESDKADKHKVDLRHRVNLCTTKPPPRDLVLTCREIYSEANKMHRVAYRDFWERNHFAIDDNNLLSKSALLALREIDLQHMGGLDIYYWWLEEGDGWDNSYYNTFRLLENKRGWDMGAHWIDDDTGEEKWENEDGYCRSKYSVNEYSRVGARHMDWDNFFYEEGLEEALEQQNGPEYDVPLKAQVISIAMQRFEKKKILWLAENDDKWFDEYYADYVGTM